MTHIPRIMQMSLDAAEDYDRRVVGGLHCSNEFGAFQLGWLDGYRAALAHAAVRGRLAQLEGKVVDDEIRKLGNE